MERKSTTANEPATEIDPGGTRPAKPHPRPEQRPDAKTVEQNVETGDRNAMKGNTP